MKELTSSNPISELRSLTRLVTKLKADNKSLRARLRKLERDDFLIVELAAEVLGTPPHLVSTICDRHGLKFKLVGSRRLYRRPDLERLRDKLIPTWGRKINNCPELRRY